jgi:superfamily II DNA or RNA helicase
MIYIGPSEQLSLSVDSCDRCFIRDEKEDKLMPFDLTIEEIRKTCDSRYYQRGLSYQRQGRVQVAEWDDDAGTLFGEVEGSGGRIYEQEISFSPAARNRIHSYCSCPIGGKCKHVVAVLLEWIEQNLATFEKRSDKRESALSDWQKETVDRLSNANRVRVPQPGDPCLLYLLEPRQYAKKTVFELRTVKSRLLKKGGWGKCSSFDLSELTGYSYYTSTSMALPGDKEIAQLLSSANDKYSSAPLFIEGDIGLLVLQRLLGSGRCFYRSIDTSPLSLGPPRQALFRWEEGETSSELKIELEGLSADWLLIPTTPPFYLDPQAYLCGQIDQPLAPGMLESLHELPQIETDQLPELSRFLLRTIPADSVPLPVELNIRTVDQAPTPQLRLHSVAGLRGSRIHMARVRFGYGPLSLPPQVEGGGDIELISYADEDWQIHRYPDVEILAQLQLLDYPFSNAEPPLAAPGEVDLLFIADSPAVSALSWREFLDELPQLEAAGWEIDIDPSFVISFETADDVYAEIEQSGNDWFDLGLNVDLGGHKVALLPLVAQWLENGSPQGVLLHQIEASRWLEIPAETLTPIIETIVELFDAPLDDDGRLRLPRSQAHNLLEIETRLGEQGRQLQWRGAKELRRLAEKLRNFHGLKAVAAPVGLNAELRDYQQYGLAWLEFLREYELNGVLADDMGLGKTIQTLSHLLGEKKAGRLDKPALIVAPTSVLSNWRREAARFTPGLSCLVLHGPKRMSYFDQLGDYDLIVTSYALLVRDEMVHIEQGYHYLILDEAQSIKNPRAKSAQAACNIPTRHRLCLTGTPLENHLGELWSLFNFLMPGFLGSQKQFTKLFRTPIEKHSDSIRRDQLQRRLAPFVLRRTKEQVAQELPPKTQMIREAELGDAQAKLYESLRLAMTDKIGKLLELKGLQKSHIEILDALLKLRQACCDPRLVKLESARKVKQSAKLEELLELLEKLLAEGRKILIFSQFTSMLALIEEELQAREIGYSKLTGRTRKRDEAIASFQEGHVPVFLISLKAGGVGLNLTAADTVIHYDPWWNPAAENQATDRAHRIGQDKPVFVYKLVAKGTVEEKILQLQEKKQQLADGIYQQKDGQQPLARIGSEELLSLLSPIDS